MIPLVDLKAQHLSIKNEIDAAIKEVIDKTAFIMGENVEGFEREFAKFCKSKYAVAVASGTAALQLLMDAYGIKKGDEVITVPNTFIATTEVITQAGATIRFVDVEPETHLMDVSKIKDATTEKTKAIIPVHLYGQMVDMQPLMELAGERDIVVIEDSCQAHGAEYKGKRTPVSEAAAFSFYPAKNLGAYGDAGCIVTDNGEIAEKTAMLRDHGRKKGEKYVHTIEGTGQRMDAIQAAILRVKLRHLEKWTDARRRNAKLYNALLETETPVEKEHAKHVYYMYVIKSQQRDALQKHLKENSIQTGIHYPLPLHLQPAYKHLGLKEGAFPEAEKSAMEILSIPMYPELTKEQITFISEKINGFAK